MKEFDIKFKVVSENVITIKAKDKSEAIMKAYDLFENSCFKDVKINNLTNQYYLVELNNRAIIKQKKQEVNE